jgi:oxygen-independent coproporphyrinogen III oxidase
MVGSGLYFHMPFCRSRCGYCHFISLPYDRVLARRYDHAVLREIESRPEIKTGCSDIDSIYFGGGTPSILAAKHILGILQACRLKFRVQDDCEISLEANPGTISKTKIAAYRRGGICRISMGAQTFSDQELSAIGRSHSSAMVFDSLRRLKEGGFENINLDLMLGLPYQTRASWKHNLETVADFGVPHVSVYMLDLDDPCPLQTRVEEGAVLLPEDDLVSDLYLETIEFLASCGYQQYEISNFARPGYACRHNLKYWKREPVYSFGLGSHSFDGNTRWANTSQMDDYLAVLEAGKNPRAWQESVNAENALQETLFLGLRLTSGVDWKCLQNSYGAESLSTYESALEDWLQQGLVQKTGDVVRLTASGMLLSNEVFQQFV